MASYLDNFVGIVKANAQSLYETFFDRRYVLPHYLSDKSSIRLVEPLRSFKHLYDQLWDKGQHGLDVLRSSYSISEDPAEKLGLTKARVIIYDVYDLNKVHFAKDFVHPSRFFIRKEYLDVSKYIGKDDKTDYVVTGNPGIGKSWYLMYELIQRLAAGKQTIYAPNAEYWFLFHSSGVYAFDATHMDKLDELIKEWYPHEPVPDLRKTPGDILFDCNSSQPDPPFDSKGWRKNWRCIITASPRHTNYGRFMKNWPSAKLCGMMPWLWYEIVTINALLPPTSKPVDQLWELYSKYGPTPRVAFGSSAASNEKKVKEAIAVCTANEILFSPLDIDVSPVTQTLLAVEPRVQSSEIYRDALVVRIATPYIADYLVRAAMRRTDLAEGFHKAIPTMLQKGRNEVLAAMLFKAAARYCLQNDDAPQVLRPLTSQKAYKLVLGIEAVRSFTSVNELKAQKEGIYYVPARPLFPAIDALAFVMKTPILIRYATTKDCPIDTSGLEMLAKVLPTTKKWSFVFIVPDFLASSFPRQSFTQPLKKKSSIYIEQYTVALSMDDVFPSPQKSIDFNLQQTTASISREVYPKRKLQKTDSTEVPLAKRLRSTGNDPESMTKSTTVRPKGSQKAMVELPQHTVRRTRRR